VRKITPAADKLRALFPAGEPDDCWPWLKYKDRNGYGMIRDGESMRLVHRVSYQTFVGPLSDELEIKHKCDFSSCWNPAHLLQGTHDSNIYEAVSRGRILKGEQHPRAKLSDAQISEIRRLLDTGIARATVARLFNISWNYVNDLDRKMYR
jgi:hypothetical protein